MQSMNSKSEDSEEDVKGGPNCVEKVFFPLRISAVYTCLTLAILSALGN